MKIVRLDYTAYKAVQSPYTAYKARIQTVGLLESRQHLFGFLKA